ncbi:acetyl-CoA synthetase-like protein [Lojkania enalia]|uniref:Acetyl-CoA synthetase-like protein n=1 Tax=Lojkania enalia TaxID=147567 RepID=A0A9P4K9W0_9PLEO|nr:acetyl-CoA synthetase-like protein [Didymosphaeria enalia]
MGSTPLSSPYSGKLLVQIIEEKAKWTPGHIYIRYPSKNWETDGYRSITWADFADSINKASFWLDHQLGKSKNQDTIAYLGPNDIRYSILLSAAVKSDRKLLVPDGRVTKEGLMSLIETTNCSAWVYAEDDDSLSKAIGVFDTDLKLCALPSIEWCLDSKAHQNYPYTKTFEEAKMDVVNIIHTSGTTGIPKPIYNTNGYYSCLHSVHDLSRKHWPRGITYDSWVGKSMINACPPQWLGGMAAYLLLPVFMDTSCIVTPSDISGLPPAVFKKLVEMNIAEGILCPPHTITQLYNDPETQPLLKSRKFIIYIGAGLEKTVGDDLATHTKVSSIIGSTENGPQISVQSLDRRLWHTHSYVPESGGRMVQISGPGVAVDSPDDLYELVLDRPKEGANLYQSAWWNPMWDGIDMIETKELYRPVKDSDGKTRWAMAGRKDDLTKLSWLAKFHATDVEMRIKRHSDVHHVFVGGEGQPTPYVLVEPKDGVLSKKSADALLDEIYTNVVVQMNKAGVEEIRIPKETVLIAKEHKPFKMSNKQTLIRKEIEKDYAEEIKEAYARLSVK